jgi:dTMP kinase
MSHPTDNRGRFVTLEGVDGAGKSTHLGSVRALIEARGVPVRFTREPGGTELGEALRELLLHRTMSLATETLLIFAARAEHLAQVIRPALADGTWIVCDRFTDPSYAYQGSARGLGMPAIEVLEQWVHADLQPDLTLLFDLPVEVSLARRKQASLELDRFEQEDREFFERVRAGYRARAAADPRRIRVIDAGRSQAEVGAQVEALIRSF